MIGTERERGGGILAVGVIEEDDDDELYVSFWHLYWKSDMYMFIQPLHTSKMRHEVNF